jgi:hypothetical protein
MIKKFLNNNYFILFVIAILVFQVTYGFSALDPTNISWLMSSYHDWGTHYLGWAFYREEPWSFPLANIQNYNYPAGSNVGFTDSIPLLSLFFKMFSFFLPEEFQYFGLWLLLCFYLTAVYSYKILKLYFNDSRLLILISVLFLILNPVLLYRGMHPALCGHWLILASIYNYLKNSSSKNALQINRNQSIIALISSLVNPYLFLMVFGFNFIIPFKNYFYEKTITLKKALFYPVISMISVVFIWFIVGMITFNNDKGLEVVDSYGLYGFNLNNFYNPSGYSNILPQLQWENHHQYEGFSYLGIGMMILILIAFILYISNKNLHLYKKKFFPLILLVLVSILFAITNKVSLNENIIFEYPTLGIIKKIGNIFRASGRFIWIFYYLLFLITFVIFIKSKLSNTLKSVILTTLLIVQLYDISSLITFRELPKGKYELNSFDKEWFAITSNFNQMVTYPPFQFDLLNTMDYQDLSYIALKNNLPITTGYAARESGDLNVKFLENLNRDLANGKIEENSIYITTNKNIADFYPAIYKNHLEIRHLNGYYLIFKGKPNLNKFKSKTELKTIDSINNIIVSSLSIREIVKPIFKTNKIKYFVEQLNDSDNLQIKGWAFLKETSNNSIDSIFIILTNDSKTYISKTRLETRTDISQTYKQGNLDNSGFRATIFKNNIDKGIYDLNIAIKDPNSGFIYEEIVPSIQIKVKTSLKVDEVAELPKYSNGAKGNLDLVEINTDKIKMRGWVTKLNSNPSNSEINILLVNTKTNYSIETDQEIRKDITSNINDGYNYDSSGFNLEIKKNKIKKGDYKILLFIDGKEKLVFDPQRTIKI